MATWIAHMRVAEHFMRGDERLNDARFLAGNIGPDCGVPSEDWSRFTPPKSVTHWQKGADIDAEDFRRKYLNPDDDRYPFYLGYYFHLLTDIEWLKFPKEKCAGDWPPKDKEFAWAVKGDWYGQDHLFLRRNPDFVFYHMFAKIKEFDNIYFDFYPPDAFIRQIQYITNFYLTAGEDPNRELAYLSKEEMDSFVGRVIDAIEKIYSVGQE